MAGIISLRDLEIEVKKVFDKTRVRHFLFDKLKTDVYQQLTDTVYFNYECIGKESVASMVKHIVKQMDIHHQEVIYSLNYCFSCRDSTIYFDIVDIVNCTTCGKMKAVDCTGKHECFNCNQKRNSV